MFLDLRLFVPKILHTATSQQRFVTVSIKYHRGDLMGSRVSFGALTQYALRLGSTSADAYQEGDCS